MGIDFNQEILKSEEAFDVCLSRNKLIIEALGYKYPHPDIDDLDSYIAHRCINIHAMFLTFYKSYFSKIDILSANSFLRPAYQTTPKPSRLYGPVLKTWTKCAILYPKSRIMRTQATQSLVILH